MVRSVSLVAALAACCAPFAAADAVIPRQQDGSDLTTFVTRPDFRVPRFNVTKYHPDRISEGYWFTAPYSRWGPRPHIGEYIPAQAGPMIYDGDGNLVWNGARIDDNRSVQDFRPYQQGNETWMSYVLGPQWEIRNDTNGSYITMDPSFTRQFEWIAPARVNAHEFKIIEGGSRALTLITNVTWVDPPNPGSSGSDAYSAGKYLDDCPAIIDMKTKQLSYEYCSIPHGLDLNVTTEQEFPHWSWGQAFDYMHANSVDKFANDDLLVSSRFLWSVFRVSKSEDRVSWVLGGKENTFVKDFEFRYQHNARIVSENETTTLITLLDNASAEKERGRESANCSSALLIALHTAELPMRAEVLQNWTRPDGELSRKRGNVEFLSNGNLWTCWSDFGYQTEHGMDGELLMEARFVSDRLSSYRAYKAPFVGHPAELPVLKAFQHSAGEDSVVEAFVSWNGATEVRSWRFDGIRSGDEEVTTLATIAKSGFETSIRVPGTWANITAYGLDAAGNVLGNSLNVTVEIAPSTFAVPRPDGFLEASSAAWAAVPHSARARVVSNVVLLTLAAQLFILATVLLFRRRRGTVRLYLPVSRERYDDLTRRQTRRLWLAVALSYRVARRWIKELRGGNGSTGNADFSPLSQEEGFTDTSDYSLDYSDTSTEVKMEH